MAALVLDGAMVAIIVVAFRDETVRLELADPK
jgi:hypothetical protein